MISLTAIALVFGLGSCAMKLAAAARCLVPASGVSSPAR